MKTDDDNGNFRNLDTLIRAGRQEEIRSLLSNEAPNIANIKINIQIPTMGHISPDSKNVKQISGSTNKDICIIVTALHLAIITKQSEIGKILLDHIQNADEKSKRSHILHQAITSKILFQCVEKDKPVSFLEGMSSLQLACQFDANAADIVIGAISRLEKLATWEDRVNPRDVLLHDNSNPLKYTALHLSLKNAMPKIAR